MSITLSETKTTVAMVNTTLAALQLMIAPKIIKDLLPSFKEMKNLIDLRILEVSGCCSSMRRRRRKRLQKDSILKKVAGVLWNKSQFGLTFQIITNNTKKICKCLSLRAAISILGKTNNSQNIFLKIEKASLSSLSHCD